MVHSISYRFIYGTCRIIQLYLASEFHPRILRFYSINSNISKQLNGNLFGPRDQKNCTKYKSYNTLIYLMYINWMLGKDGGFMQTNIGYFIYLVISFLRMCIDICLLRLSDSKKSIQMSFFVKMIFSISSTLFYSSLNKRVFLYIILKSGRII